MAVAPRRLVERFGGETECKRSVLGVASVALGKHVPDFEDANRRIESRKIRHEAVGERSPQVSLFLGERIAHFDRVRELDAAAMRAIEYVATVQRVGNGLVV